MYSTQFHPLLIHHFKFSRLIGSIPFEFDSQSGKLIVMKSRRRIRVYQVQYFMTIIYLLVVLCNFILGDFSVQERLQGIPFLIIYFLMIVLGWNVGLDIAPIQVVNSMLSFERGLLQGMHTMATFQSIK